MVTSNITQGAEVYSSDGEKLGKVAEVRGSRFRVDVSMMPDYWLPTDAVTASTAGRVTVQWSKDAINDHKVDAPAA